MAARRRRLILALHFLIRHGLKITDDPGGIVPTIEKSKIINHQSLSPSALP
jgi:hypothetical protein